MNMKDTIYQRKSFRSYSEEKLSAETLHDIENFIKNAKPLYPELNSVGNFWVQMK